MQFLGLNTWLFLQITMPKEMLMFDMARNPGQSWGIRIGGGQDRGRALVLEKVRRTRRRRIHSFGCLVETFKIWGQNSGQFSSHYS